MSKFKNKSAIINCKDALTNGKECIIEKFNQGCKKYKVDFDGCSFHATCSRCGKSVMQDSQGNWF